MSPFSANTSPPQRISADEIDMEGPSPFKLVKSPKSAPATGGSAAQEKGEQAKEKSATKAMLPAPRPEGQSPKSSADDAPQKLLLQPRPTKGALHANPPAPQVLAAEAPPKAKPGEKAILPATRNTARGANPFEANETLRGVAPLVSAPEAEPNPEEAPVEAKNGSECRKIKALPKRKGPIQGELFGSADFHSSGQKGASSWVGTGHLPQRSGESAELQTRQPIRATYSGRKIKFSCPQCMQTISLPRSLAGKKTRCPACVTAIKAADPKNRRKAYSYESDISSLIHPERFAMARPPRPKFLGIPLPRGHTAVLGGAAAMLVAGFGWMGYSALNKDQGVLQTVAPSANPPTLEQIQVAVETPVAPAVGSMEPVKMKENAKSLVENFLKADGTEAKQVFVRDAARVGKLMESYYASNPGGPAEVPTKLDCSAISYYSGSELPQPVATVAATLPSGQQLFYKVEFLAGGPKIEWESSVAYCPKPWEKIVAEESVDEPQLLRVAANLGKFYDQQFSDDSEHVCVELRNPQTLERLGWGYLPVDSEDGARMKKYLQGVSSRRPESVMIEIRPVENSSKSKQVEIVRFIKGGFRADESTALAENRVGASF